MRNTCEFVCSTFGFQGLRIDEALRLYLEAFRLPGEAPVIQRLLETFTDNWHVSQRLSAAVAQGDEEPATQPQIVSAPSWSVQVCCASL